MDKKRIAQLRQRFGWSQERFSKALGVVNRLTISHWETGVRRPSGAAKRFLTYLETIPDSDFKKATSTLEEIAEKEHRKR